MSYVRIWVHAVFSTRRREPYLNSEIRAKLFEHIRINCREKGILLDSIGGWSDHAHLLISLGKDQTISKAMMLLKGESSNWLNKQGFFRGKFSWQDDYYAISVSESQVDEVRRYIRRQEEHHMAIPFDREVNTLEKLFR